MMRSLSLLLAFALLATTTLAQLPPGVVDTQPNGDAPPTPKESLAKITVPDGFRVTLFAGEPDVHQPIDMTFDDRGRLWVVECYTYPDWRAKNSDRILIFEDTDNDGQFDTRKVFAENLHNITGIALGFGGVWACATPELVFIPDRNGDDQPDGPPVAKLDGWNDVSDDVEHNVFNGLVWGPDGWMYGGHGILADSMIGKPGDPHEKRHRMNCGIWRYHPVKDEFEIVAHGTTNPWGIDFDEMGECFFTNSVIGHLWHLIPGARYERMYGTHYNPHTYALIDQCADHYHWGGGRWTESRDGVGIHSKAGGGHAHVGAMIYRGGAWPQEYNGSLFTCNLHGNRINRDSISRKASGHTATHEQDFLLGNDPWLRGIDLLYGPDGNVVVSDWTDLGECHDKDGAHRSSGRIYKISYGDAKPLPKFDLTTKSNTELLAFVDHKNAWYWTHARRLLHERTVAGVDMLPTIKEARKLLSTATTTSTRLRLLNAITLIGGADQVLVTALMNDSDEFVQCWAARHLVDLDHQTAVREMLDVLSNASPKLQLQIASLLQRLRLADRWKLATSLISHFPDMTEDPNLLPMIWFAIEPLSEVDPERFIALAKSAHDNTQLALLRQYIAQRVVVDPATRTRQIDSLLQTALSLNPRAREDILVGIRNGLRAEKSAPQPRQWSKIQQAMANTSYMDVNPLVDEMSIKFNDANAINRLKSISLNRTAPIVNRRAAMKMLAANKSDGTRHILTSLLEDDPVRMTAIQSLSSFNLPAVAKAILQNFNQFSDAEKAAAVSTLVTSRQHAKLLLQAVASGKVPASIIKPAQANAINQLRDDTLREQLREHWGDLRRTPREQQQKITQWKAKLHPDLLADANLANGEKVFAENCGKCHKLFGKGKSIGPDLTGSDRRNLDYILQNVITPSAAVGKEFRMHSVMLIDGRVVTGSMREQTQTTIVVQTAEKQVTIPRNEIDDIEPTDLSLMPEGQFDALPEETVKDLVAYLSSDAE